MHGGVSFAMPSPIVQFLKRTPFLRLLLPLMAGISTQWYWHLPLSFCWIVLGASGLLIICFSRFSLFRRHQFSWFNGVAVSLLLIAVGALLTAYADVRYAQRWFGKYYGDGAFVVVSTDEPLIEKARSFKADATVRYVMKENKMIKTRGKIILYLMKDSLLPNIPYGTQLILRKPLQEIRNSGNPGGFDYKRYALFHDITHQVYVTPGEFEILSTRNTTIFQRIFYPAREEVLRILRRYITSKEELGMAEALLIGYKNDLDKTLVQSYSNTGVVHVIAISGLHIGLIYWLLGTLVKPLQKRKQTRWLRPLLIITGLWAFSLLAGGQPSVLRSAVMFTCIVLGQSFSRRTSIYNTMALSAFLLLCYNPYWLWDAGFQLSYSAVLSIIIFMKPVYHLFYIKNKLLDAAWKLNAVTLAAQILTLPFSIYHFHQFPASFWMTNFLAVPLSSVVVLGEILLCGISFIPAIAIWVGKILIWLIALMNSYVKIIEDLPASLWNGLQIDAWQMVLLFGCIAASGFWLIGKIKQGVSFALGCLLGFAFIRSYSFIHAGRQQKIVVYNVAQHQAIDFVDGRKFVFIGDSALLEDDFARNFHLEPSRVLHRVTQVKSISGLVIHDNYIVYRNEKILLIDSTMTFAGTPDKQKIDLLIVSKNPRLYFKKLAEAFTVKQVVFDASVPSWKLVYWKRDCDSLHIPWHDVKEKGALVMNIQSN